MFKVGETVHVKDQGYSGEIIEIRKNDDGSTDCHVRYSVPFGRKPYYETWWPVGHLSKK